MTAVHVAPIALHLKSAASSNMAVIRQHIMLSYQWDIQPLVQSVYARLDSMGYPVWMDVEGGMSGSINDSMASGTQCQSSKAHNMTISRMNTTLKLILSCSGRECVCGGALHDGKISGQQEL